jgi:citrate synthase
MSSDDAWLDAHQAAGQLGVSRQTLYAYVSRGLLYPEPVAGRRASRYRRADIARLAARQGARSPKRAAQGTLDWGLPVLDSALTLIDDGRLHYRGHDALQLAARASLEDIAALLWSEPLAEGFELMRRVRAATTGAALPASARGAPMHRQLQALWRLPDAAADTVRVALVLCADHELNASSFTTRVVASTGASLQACVSAGLAALSGPRHGGATAAIEDHWDGWLALPRRGAVLRRTVARTIAEPGCTPQGLGFGHTLYPAGDPRAAALLARLPADARRARFVAAVHAFTGLRPSVDFALVALRRALGLPLGSAFAIFAIARSVGWVAHALEQRAAQSLIRPRARYVGPRPGAQAQPAPAGRVVHVR